jgi:hypothetical protein
MKRTIVLAVLFVVAASACKSMPGMGGGPSAGPAKYHLVGAPTVYTLVNLHPDEQRRRLYSINYLQPGLIPMCTPVKIESVDDREMVFRLVNGDRQYEYIFHKALREPVPQHLDKYFGTKCDANKAASMSAVDAQGIRSGTVTMGMTKQGVIHAIGYPPDHATPTLESNTWTYWKNRFGQKFITFTDGKVTGIKD